MSGAVPRSKKAIISICTAAAVIIVFAVLTGLYYYGAFTFPSQDGNTVVWKSGNSVYIKKGEALTSFSGYDAVAVKITKGNRIFIKTVSLYNSSLFDIYYCEKKFNKISSPKLIDYAVKDTAFISDDGNMVYYLKTNEKYGVLDAVCHNIKTGKRNVFDTNVKEFFFFENEDILYYTKMHSSDRALYRLDDGEGKLVSKGIKTLNMYSDEERSEIVYTTSKGTVSNAYIVRGTEKPERIGQNFSKMMIDGYKPGGNIYFFRSATSEMNWSSVITDSNAEADEAMTKPNKRDYWSFFGFSNDYNRAYYEYQSKLIRDSVREGLDDACEKGQITITNYEASVYDGEDTIEFKSNINPDGVISASMEGTPLIIYENIVVSDEKKDLSEFADMAMRMSVDNIVGHALTFINESVRTEGYAVSRVVTAKEEKKEKKYLFKNFSAENNAGCYYSDLLKGLVVLKNDGESDNYKIFLYKFDGKSGFAEKAKKIDENVTDYIVTCGGLLYMREGNREIYRYDENGKVKLSSSAVTFFSDNLSDVYIMKEYKYEDGVRIGDFYVTSGGEETLIAEKCNVDKFSFSSSMACAIDSEKKLWLVSSGSRELVAENAGEILAYR